jgi:hypothetical protein
VLWGDEPTVRERLRNGIMVQRFVSVADGPRRMSPAGVSRGGAQHQNAEKIKPVLDGFRRAAEREDQCSRQVEPRQQGGQRVFAASRDHGESHACAATTIASTPACKVGWITGANPGL